MRVSEVMTAGVQTVRPGTPAATARERMRSKAIHHLLVKEGTEIVGVLSARDLARGTRTGTRAKRVVVADFMTPRVVTLGPPTPAPQIALAQSAPPVAEIPPPGHLDDLRRRYGHLGNG